MSIQFLHAFSEYNCIYCMLFFRWIEVQKRKNKTTYSSLNLKWYQITFYLMRRIEISLIHLFCINSFLHRIYSWLLAIYKINFISLKCKSQYVISSNKLCRFGNPDIKRRIINLCIKWITNYIHVWYISTLYILVYYYIH